MLPNVGNIRVGIMVKELKPIAIKSEKKNVKQREDENLLRNTAFLFFANYGKPPLSIMSDI